MIEIKNNRIYFHNTNNRDIVPVDFPCMSAYICPHCKMVLAAYYAGVIADLEPFLEDASHKYHYKQGKSNGGQYLLLEEYQHKKSYANLDIVSLHTRGVKRSLEAWAKHESINSTRIHELAELIEAGKVPGFEIVPDICGTDAPILLYNEYVFINMNSPDFEESMKRKSYLTAYVDWVVSGDYSKPFEPPAPPEEQEVDPAANGSQSPFGEIISAYSRAQAIADGTLIDVTETAKEAGIVFPTAVTQALWSGYIVPPESLGGSQDTQGRLWDVLTMLAFNARRGGEVLFFDVVFLMPSRTINPKMETIRLKSVCGPGDNAEPVITLMMPDED